MSTALETSRSALSDALGVIERIAAGADRAPAISAPDRGTLTHGGLRRQMRDTVRQLAALGIGNGESQVWKNKKEVE